jgi:hypothetical protein
MKEYWGNGRETPYILNRCIGKWWVVSFTLRPFYLHWKNTLYTFCRRLDGYQKRRGRGDDESNPDSTENRTPAMQPAASHLAANGEAGGRPGDTPAADLQLPPFLLTITAWKQVFGGQEFFLLLPLRQVWKLKVHAFTYTKQKSFIHIGKLR